jgi:ribose/xylose/arabinose/galactoside ABC-type transport system permease subunit
VGSLLALVTCVFFGLVDGGWPWAIALPLMFLLAMGLGALNGLMIAFLAIPALIATLGTWWRFAAWRCCIRPASSITACRPPSSGSARAS